MFDYEFITSSQHFWRFMFWQIGLILSSMALGAIMYKYYIVHKAFKDLDKPPQEDDISLH